MISQPDPSAGESAANERVHSEALRKNTNELVKFSMAPATFNSSNGSKHCLGEGEGQGAGRQGDTRMFLAGLHC